jgi:hypothetical protein
VWVPFRLIFMIASGVSEQFADVLFSENFGLFADHR